MPVLEMRAISVELRGRSQLETEGAIALFLMGWVGAIANHGHL